MLIYLEYEGLWKDPWPKESHKYTDRILSGPKTTRTRYQKKSEIAVEVDIFMKVSMFGYSLAKIK